MSEVLTKQQALSLHAYDQYVADITTFTFPELAGQDDLLDLKAIYVVEPIVYKAVVRPNMAAQRQRIFAAHLLSFEEPPNPEYKGAYVAGVSLAHPPHLRRVAFQFARLHGVTVSEALTETVDRFRQQLGSTVSGKSRPNVEPEIAQRIVAQLLNERKATPEQILSSWEQLHEILNDIGLAWMKHAGVDVQLNGRAVSERLLLGVVHHANGLKRPQPAETPVLNSDNFLSYADAAELVYGEPATLNIGDAPSWRVSIIKQAEPTDAWRERIDQFIEANNVLGVPSVLPSRTPDERARSQRIARLRK